jgi:hypothetical protein
MRWGLGLKFGASAFDARAYRWATRSADPGRMTMLTAAEQDLRVKAERALDRLNLAKARGDPLELAQAKLAAAFWHGELQKAGAATGAGALASMRQALTRQMKVS